MGDLSEKSLENALEEIKSFKELNGPLSIKATKLLLPPHIIKYLASIGIDTQEKITKLYEELIKDTKI